jgi:hypothetical protein
MRRYPEGIEFKIFEDVDSLAVKQFLSEIGHEENKK